MQFLRRRPGTSGAQRTGFDRLNRQATCSAAVGVDLTMARPLRLDFAGGLFHVLARGDDKRPIYLDERDMRSFLERLDTVSERLQWSLWGFCLMPNHYHLLLETTEKTLSRGMRDLNGAYSQAFNRRHGRVGHVFQGRFKSLIVDRESYLLELARYLANNPVRAGLCRRAEDWPWSSHRQVVGFEPQATSALRVAALLRYFGDDPDEARTRYARFVDRHRHAPSPFLNTRHQAFLGDAEFVDVVTTAAPRPSREVTRTQRAWRTLDHYAVAYVDRDLAIAAAYRDGHHSVRAIAAHFELHPSSISRIVRLVANSPTVRRRGRKGKVRYLPWRPDR